MRFWIVFGLACVCAFAQQEVEPRHRKLYWISTAAMASASAFDYATSLALNGLAKKGRVREQNTLLENNSGGFDAAKGAAFKLGASGAMVAAELWLRHHYGNHARTFDRSFAAINFGASGIFWQSGIHNVRIGRPLGAY